MPKRSWRNGPSGRPAVYRGRVRAATILFVAVTGSAGARADEGKKEALAAIEVERGWVLPRGWSEAGVGLEVQRSEERWSEDGGVAPGAVFSRATVTSGWRFGIARGMDVEVRVPVSAESLAGEEAAGLGDVGAAWRWAWWSQRAPNRTFGSEISLSLPTGARAEGAVLGAAASGGIPLGTGSVGLTAGVGGTRQLGPIRASAEARLTHWFPGESGFVLAETSSTWVQPGDGVLLQAEALVQLAVLAPTCALTYRRWGAARVGDDFGLQLGDRVEDSGGWGWEVAPGVVLDLSRGVQLSGAVRIPLRGEGDTFFPVVSLSPVPGPAWSAGLRVRF